MILSLPVLQSEKSLKEVQWDSGLWDQYYLFVLLS